MINTKFNFYKVSVELAVKMTLFREKLKNNELVSEAFSLEDPLTFVHQGQTLAYVMHNRVGDYIIGSLGKQSEAELSGPPSTGFAPILQDEWPHVLMIVNVSSRQPLGQTIAIQKDDRVFRHPKNQLQSLLEESCAQNQKLDGYELIVNSVTTKESFWDIVRSRTGSIQKLTFDLAAPNFLGLNDSLSKSMKEIKTQFNATKATVSIENPEGSLQIPKSSEFVQEAVNYATKGAGDIKLKVKEEGTVDAKRNKVTAQITAFDTRMVVEGENIQTVQAICDRLFLCLKDLE